jgi:hypothetical protein
LLLIYKKAMPGAFHHQKNWLVKTPSTGVKGFNRAKRDTSHKKNKKTLPATREGTTKNTSYCSGFIGTNTLYSAPDEKSKTGCCLVGLFTV